jgi:hypothetical protein
MIPGVISNAIIAVAQRKPVRFFARGTAATTDRFLSLNCASRR